MSTISRLTEWNTGDTLTAADLEAEFNNIVNDYNGAISNANVAADAAIAYSKLNLSGSILNTDINNSAAIAITKIANGADTSTVQTFTNKRITKKIGTVASSATPTINTDLYDGYTITALAAAITSMSSGLSGTPTALQVLIIRIKDDGTPRTISWGISFASRGAVLPVTTVLGKYLYVGLLWNEQASTWDCIAVSTET